MRHKHHIIPRYMGGTDDADNIVELTVLEHADAHNLLYCLYKNKEDWLAEQGLLGYYKKEDIIKEIFKNNGRKSWEAGMTPNRIAHYTSKKLKEHGKKLGETSIFKDSKVQTELGKRAAKSANHPNNKTETCEHCGKSMNIGHIRRYHGNNCKLREEN